MTDVGETADSAEHTNPEPAPLLPLLAAEQYAQLLEHMPCGLLFFDASGRIIHLNAEARRAINERYPELAGEHYEQYAAIGIREDGTPLLVEDYALVRCLRTGQPQAPQLMGFRLPDGRTAWAVFAAVPLPGPDGSPSGAAVSFVDVTASRRALQAIRYLHEETGALFGAQFLAESVCYLSRILRVRFAFVGEYDAATRTVETRAMSASGEPAPNMTYSIAGTPCEAVIEQGRGCSITDCVAERFPSDHLLVEMNVRSYHGFPLRDDTGRLQGLLVLLHDEARAFDAEERGLIGLFAFRAAAELGRLRFERERAQLLAQEQAARADAEAALSVRDVFLSVASHELNTPLAALQLQLDGLLRAARGESSVALSPERLVGALEHAQALGRRLNRLVESLLDTTQISGTGDLILKPEPFELVSVVEEAIDHLSETLSRAGCDVTWERAESVRGHWDRFRLYQCAVNLLSNALKYGRGRPILVSAFRHGDRARLVVRDQGIGIPPRHHERIFERFERAHDNNYGGLGLGLYIVRHIVHAHGGTVGVESAPGQGAAFTIDLPIAPAC